MLLKRAAQKKPEINIIPMVDIVFQLIIFFLVAMQVKQNKMTRLELARAKSAQKVEKDETALIINIVSPKRDKRMPYRVMQQAHDINSLKDLLARKKRYADARKEEMPIVRVRADMNSEYKAIQDALKACAEAKIWQIRFTTIKPSN